MVETAKMQKNGTLSPKRMDSLVMVAEGLVARIPAFKGGVAEVVDALHDILDGADLVSIDARTKVQMHLMHVANELLIGVPARDDMLSTEEAAKLMNCSRPYVAMLVDRKRLPGATKSSGGHRRIPRESILTWIKNNPPATEADADYKAAAKEAGMYDIPEETYIAVSVARRKAKAVRD